MISADQETAADFGLPVAVAFKVSTSPALYDCVCPVVLLRSAQLVALVCPLPLPAPFMTQLTFEVHEVFTHKVNV